MKNNLINNSNEKAKKKSKTTQLNGYEIIAVESTQLEQKFPNNEYPFSLSTDNKRLEKEKQFYLSKTNRFYNNTKKDKKPKELIIDTRTPFNLINPEKKQKFNFLDYRHKKYQTHKFPFKLKSDNKSYEKNNNYITYYNNKDDESIKEDNLTLEQKVKNIKYQFLKAPVSGYLPNYPLTYSHLPHKSIGNSLYTILSLRKNQFEDGYNRVGDNEALELPKLRQMQFLLNNNNSSPMSSYFGRRDEYRKYVDLLNQPFSYISLLNDDYSISEKMRFQKMMDKLNKVKKCIEENPDEEFEIAKEFILNIGLYDITNLDIDKLNNFLNFIKNDFLIDPSKNIKENVYNILNRNNIYKPSISNALDCINEEYLLNELKKKQNLIKHKKIGDLFNSFIDKYDKMQKKTNNIKSISKINENVANKTIINFEENKNFDINKKKQIKTLNNNSKKPKPLEHKGLCIDLKRQQEINLLEKKKEIDIVRNPHVVIDLIRKDIVRNKNKTRAKTHYNWCRNVYKNKRLYNGKRLENAEYNEVKKKNMLTEYICLMKATKNMKQSQLKEIYKL